MSTARIFDFAEYVEPDTDPHGIPPVAAEVPVDTRPSRDIWKSMCRAKKRVKKLTKPTRIGYRVYRREHQKMLANPHGHFLASEYMELVRTSDGEAKHHALELYMEQIGRNNRRFCFRWLIIHYWNLAIVGGEVYALFAVPTWAQAGLTVAVGALITTRWTRRGRRVMRARRRLMAKRRQQATLQFEQPELKVVAEPFNSLNEDTAYVESDDLPVQAQEVPVMASEVPVAPDPRYRLLYDILDVATPTAGQILDHPLNKFVIQTDPLLEKLRKHESGEYKKLDRSELIKRLGKFGLRSHQKNLTPTWDGKRPNRTGWHFEEINDVIERGSAPEDADYGKFS